MNTTCPISTAAQALHDDELFPDQRLPGANGIKTGTTNAGGPCLVASATQDGRTVIASIMNSDDRFGDAQKLMAYGFSVLKPVEPAENVYILRQAPAGQTLSDIRENRPRLLNWHRSRSRK